MNADDIRAYKMRWQMVAEHEREEVARASAAQKFADIAILMIAARALGGSSAGDEKEVEQVRRRWNLLVERMGA